MGKLYNLWEKFLNRGKKSEIPDIIAGCEQFKVNRNRTPDNIPTTISHPPKKEQ